MNFDYFRTSAVNGIEMTQDEIDSFVDIEKFVDSLASFSAFVIKIVLKSTSIAAYPKVKDLRIIALE